MSNIGPLEWWTQKRIVLIFIHSWEWRMGFLDFRSDTNPSTKILYITGISLTNLSGLIIHKIDSRKHGNLRNNKIWMNSASCPLYKALHWFRACQKQPWPRRRKGCIMTPVSAGWQGRGAGSAQVLSADKLPEQGLFLRISPCKMPQTLSRQFGREQRTTHVDDESCA